MTWKLREATLTPSGKLEEYYIDDATGEVLNVITQSVDDLIDHNGALRSLGDKGWSKSRLYRRTSSIPLALADQWKMKDGLDVMNPDHAKDVQKRLRDPDYSKLRTDG